MAPNPNITIVLGAQFGDEGKGKLTDILAHNAQLCCRAAGGNNAGHTIVADGIKYDFHILPSGLINKTCSNLIGTGCVVHIPSFFAELDALKSKGLNTDGRIFISDAAHVVFDLHQRVDGLEEQGLGSAKVGTTGKGIGPCYSTKAARTGIRVGELVYDKQSADRRLRALAKSWANQYGASLTTGPNAYDVEAEIKRMDDIRAKLLEGDYVRDAVTMFTKAQDNGTEILIEGANALLLDINYGTYPFVTSSETGLAGCFSGLGGLKRRAIKEVVGVVKAYSTRVGMGPFPTEQLQEDGKTENEVGRTLQERGAEFGVTTGRRRRCGWLDAVQLRHSQQMNDYDAINLTKLDVLDTFAEIKVGIAYHIVDPSSGEKTRTLERFPTSISVLDGTSSVGKLEVEYKTFKGWQKDTQGVKVWDELPKEAQEYVNWIGETMGVPVRYIGTGPKREDMVSR